MGYTGVRYQHDLGEEEENEEEEEEEERRRRKRNVDLVWSILFQ